MYGFGTMDNKYWTLFWFTAGQLCGSKLRETSSWSRLKVALLVKMTAATSFVLAV